MTIFEKLSTLAEITDQDEMIKSLQNHSKLGTSSGSGGSCSGL